MLYALTLFTLLCFDCNPDGSSDLPRIKTIKSLLEPELYENLKKFLKSKRLFPVQFALITKLLQRGPRRDYAVQGQG